jgi:hypothetical protein
MKPDKTREKTREMTRNTLCNNLRKSTRAVAALGIALALLPLAGCAQAPSYDIMGSLFPAWLVCIVLGILLTIAGRWLLLRFRINVVWPGLVYPCLAAFFTFALWLIWFY